MNPAEYASSGNSIFCAILWLLCYRCSFQVVPIIVIFLIYCRVLSVLSLSGCVALVSLYCMLLIDVHALILSKRDSVVVNFSRDT